MTSPASENKNHSILHAQRATIVVLRATIVVCPLGMHRIKTFLFASPHRLISPPSVRVRMRRIPTVRMQLSQVTLHGTNRDRLTNSVY